jgi:type IV pilus assembly protein PilA
MNKIQQGFTLIELMIVVAIIGILAAVAIPSYQDYTARAQVTEGMSLTSQYKTPLAEYYADQGTFTGITPTDVGGGTQSGKYVDSVAFKDAAGMTIAVVATFKDVGVNAQVKSKDFGILTTDGGKTWLCGTADDAANYTTVESKLVPGSCK